MVNVALNKKLLYYIWLKIGHKSSELRFALSHSMCGNVGLGVSLGDAESMAVGAKEELGEERYLSASCLNPKTVAKFSCQCYAGGILLLK